MRPDKEDNDAIYGREITQREILTGNVAPPAGAEALYSALNRYAHGHSAQR